jgi:DNA replication protein DnaC
MIWFSSPPETVPAVMFLGPPGTGKTHLPTGLGIRACQADHRVAFATAAQGVTRLTETHQAP